jgi:hypothetical protein
MDVRSKQQSSSPRARFETAPPGWLWRRAYEYQRVERLARSIPSFLRVLRIPKEGCQGSGVHGVIVVTSVLAARRTNPTSIHRRAALCAFPASNPPPHPTHPALRTVKRSDERQIPPQIRRRFLWHARRSSSQNPRRSKKLIKEREKADAWRLACRVLRLQSSIS